MRALVTGAAGFIGSRLSHRLVAEGNDVVGLDDLSEGSSANLDDAPEVELIQADLRDETAVISAAKGCDVIFHQGAIRSVPRSMDEPALTTDVNVRGTLNVAMAAKEAGSRVVFASSSSVYGDQESFPLREDMSPRPKSPYAGSKLAGEVYCSVWWRAFGVPTVSLRYFNVYGPRQNPLSEYAAVVPRFILACLRGLVPEIHGDGEQARDFTYVDDVVEANVRAGRANEEAFGRAFNVGGGRGPTSVNQLLAIVADATRTRPQPRFTPSRPGDVRWTEGDITLAGSLLGYRSRTDVVEGIRRTVEWFRGSDALPDTR
jgi:nucleoside-diphosphate-sugar epimerase